jgi:uncharacterized protein
MKIDLRQLREPSGSVSGTDRVEFTDAAGDETTVDCDVVATYNHAGGACYLHVRARGRYDTVCHRCLDAAGVALDVEFDVVVRRGVDRAGSRGDESADNHYIMIGANEHEVSLHPLIRENVVVDIPMLILCSDDCKGLCPRCGTNRNHGACRCEPAPDPRWEALRRLGGQ